MLETRINARLSGSLANFVEHMVGEYGHYETPSEYIRDLIRKDMTKHQSFIEQNTILQGYRDVAAERLVESTGDLLKDIQLNRGRKASRKK